MKRITVLIVWLCAAASIPCLGAVIRTVPNPNDEPTTRKRPDTRPAATSKVRIRVLGSNWGDADTDSILKVLRSAASQLWSSFPGRRLHPIVVQPGRWAPITLYRRGPKGEYLMKLTPKGRYWCQFTYQFAHEFCHVLANYSHKTPRANKWFEESICEMAAIYTLRRMAIAWRTSPPHRRWKGYHADIQAYADDLQKPGDKLPKGKTLTEWYKENSKALRKNPCLRDKNRKVANELLGLFEKNPAGWGAIEYLNSGRPKSDSFQDYMSNWYLKTPAKHRKIIGRIMEKFSLKIPKTAAVKKTSPRDEPLKPAS